ncbi:TonB-dependent receptor [Zhongshania aquimaris]|uniref:TonB-dependent receptor n=1 Tax=Zhongshania aquimaris TaxID=2857107 RepID=A0ABS6VSU9_9GAMM|nr:TonB-dependent receptor [Zhongshania aquimaris]MBW2941346.1 TonB-dependent receptor [Zhongshania aquimaris]
MIKNRSVTNIALLTAVTGLSLSATPAYSQDDTKYTIEEVIVTAQKRQESLQDVGASITAVTSEKLNDYQVVNVLDLESFSPNVSIGTDFGTAKIFIRGIGLVSNFFGIDPSVALHVDGVVVSPGQAQLGVFYDLERVEVLRGPQGSLYGRNSTGGSINLITNKPTEETTGYIHTTLGNYSLITTEAAIGGTIIDNKLLGRIALKANKREGYGENELFATDIDDANQLSGRIQLEYRAADNLNMLLSGSRQREDDNAYVLHFIETDGTNNPATLPPIGSTGLTADNPRNIRSNYAPAFNIRNSDAYNATINWDIDDQLAATSITAHRTFDSVNIQDMDASLIPGLNVYNARETESFSQEFQLHFSGDKTDGLVGAYYYKEKLNANSPLGLDPVGVNGPPDAIVRVKGVMDVEASALFANFNFFLSEAWSLTLGGRYSVEERKKSDQFTTPGGTIPFADDGDWNDFTVDIGVEYQPVEDINLYAKFSQGFKSGAANLGQISAFVDPEEVDAFEVGVKGLFLDRTLSLSAAAFVYDFTNMQLGKTTPAPGGAFGSKLENAGESEIMGAEVELSWVASRDLRINAQLGYLDTEIKEFTSVNELDPCAGGTAGCDPNDSSTFITQQFAGNELVQAPELTANINGEYDFNLESGDIISVNVGAYHRSRIYFSAFNTDNMSENAITTYNANVKFRHRDEKLSLSIWAKNITDEEYYTSKFAVSTSYSIMGTLAPPSTYGVTVNYDF